MAKQTDYFCSDTIREDLKGKTVRGGVYTAAAQAGSMLIQIGTLPILARLLVKDDFGLVAMALVFTGFAQVFVDAGMSMATVQREKLSHAQVSNLFWLSSGLGLVMAVLAAAFAPAIAWFYGKPELMPIVIALGVPYLFAGMTTQHSALMKRAMLFKQLAFIQVTANLLARCLAVYLAWRYRSYWALVAGHATLPLFILVLSWLLSGWTPGLPRKGTGVRKMVGFGMNLTGFHFLNYFSRNVDNLLIGKFWGEGQLGLYDLAYRLFMAPVRKINGPVSTVAVPALSRLVDQPNRYRKYYLGMVSRLALVSAPLALFLFAAADLIIPWCFGPGWEGSAPILRALVVAGVVTIIGNTSGWLFISQGRDQEMLRWGVVATPIIIASFLLGLPWGALGVAYSYTAVILFVIYPMVVARVCRKGPIRQLDMYVVLLRPVGLGVLVALCVVAARLIAWDASPAAVLAVAVGLSCLAVGVVVLSIPAARAEVAAGCGVAMRYVNDRYAGPGTRKTTKER